MKILVTNRKGGVGKSTIAANLAAYFAIKKVINTAFIDFDKQASSSNWLRKLSHDKIKAYQSDIFRESNPGLALLSARASIRDASKTAELVIADLTWNYGLPFQFLLEFDVVIVPSAISRVEMTSSEIFVMEYLQKNLSLTRKNSQLIIMVPSRIESNQSTEGLFPFLMGNSNCVISPPVQKVGDIDAYYCRQFLCTAQDKAVAKNFCEFGSFIYEKSRSVTSPSQSSELYAGASIADSVKEKDFSPVLPMHNKKSGVDVNVPSSTHLKVVKFLHPIKDRFIPAFLRNKNQ